MTPTAQGLPLPGGAGRPGPTCGRHTGTTDGVARAGSAQRGACAPGMAKRSAEEIFAAPGEQMTAAPTRETAGAAPLRQ